VEEIMACTKDEMARTFLALADRFGYRRATVEEVAERCRISKKTIYGLFESKAALYEYALGLWAEDQRAAVEARLTAGTSVRRLAQWVELAFADARESAGSDRNPDADGPAELVAEVNERVFAPLITDLLVRGNEEGAWTVADPELTARFCVAVGVEGVARLLHDRGRDTEAATLETIRRIVGVQGGA
jgi:AcrR family transcriptional regulator